MATPVMVIARTAARQFHEKGGRERPPHITHVDVALSKIMSRLEGASVHLINHTGRLWQRESFDHILRSDEKLAEVREYICMNPVRAGLAATPDEYPWLWRSWVA